MLYENILNDSFYKKLTPVILNNSENPEAPEVKAAADELMPPALAHLVRELPAEHKFICGNKMTVHDYTIGHWLTNCFRNPNAFHRNTFVEWEKENMPPRIVRYLDDIEAELKEYFDKRNSEKPKGF